MGNTYLVIGSMAIVRRRGGSEGGEGRRWGRHVDGALHDGDFGRLHADPVRMVILREGRATKEQLWISVARCKTSLPIQQDSLTRKCKQIAPEDVLILRNILRNCRAI